MNQKASYDHGSSVISLKAQKMQIVRKPKQMKDLQHFNMQ